MIRLLILSAVALMGWFSVAQDLETDWPRTVDAPAEAAREPSSVLKVSGNRKRHFAGGADEEDLRVQPSLPEASIVVDARSLQREVFKQLYKQDLKEEQQNDSEE